MIIDSSDSLSLAYIQADLINSRASKFIDVTTPLILKISFIYL